MHLRSFETEITQAAGVFDVVTLVSKKESKLRTPFTEFPLSLPVVFVLFLPLITLYRYRSTIMSTRSAKRDPVRRFANCKSNVARDFSRRAVRRVQSGLSTARGCR